MASSSDTARQGFFRFIRGIFSAKEEDMTCDECFVHLDSYVDMIAEGKDPSTVMKDVKDHLEQCPCCEEEFQALLSMIKSIDT